MGNDKRHIRVLGRQQVNGGNLTHYVVQHWQTEGFRRFTDLACDSPIVSMDFDSAETVLPDCGSDELAYAATVTIRMDKGKSRETLPIAGYDSRDFQIGDRVVR